jgi:hypothetical protein
MLRLEVNSVHSLALSPLCASCPQGRAGCCAAPPAIAWADLGRIVLLGGRDFLLDELKAGRLRPSKRGLSILRVPANEDFPARCNYLGPKGCVLEPAKRSSTCNHYLCEDALTLAESEGDPSACIARNVTDNLAAILGRFDLVLAELIDELYPEGAPFDEAFFDWIAKQTDSLIKQQKRALGARLSRSG